MIGLRRSIALAVAIAAAGCSTALAHGTGVEQAETWDSDAWVLSPLAVGFSFYVCGLTRLWWRSGFGRGIAVSEAVSFLSGWVVTFAALVTPLHTIGETLFVAHMVEHELLMTIAAPLLVLGQPQKAFVWAFAGSLRPLAGRLVQRLARAKPVGRASAGCRHSPAWCHVLDLAYPGTVRCCARGSTAALATTCDVSCDCTDFLACAFAGRCHPLRLVNFLPAAHGASHRISWRTAGGRKRAALPWSNICGRVLGAFADRGPATRRSRHVGSCRNDLCLGGLFSRGTHNPALRPISAAGQ